MRKVRFEHELKVLPPVATATAVVAMLAVCRKISFYVCVFVPCTRLRCFAVEVLQFCLLSQSATVGYTSYLCIGRIRGENTVYTVHCVYTL